MLSAAIDVGSNTLRLLIGSVQDDEIARAYSDRAITRLAEGIGETGRLGKENIERSLSALKTFSSAIVRYGASSVRAVGTSALRVAENSGEFIARAYEESGIRIEVISGIREAELTVKGVMAGFTDITGPLLIIDIGGGSLEWILREGKPSGAFACGSLPIGVVTLHERFIRADPPVAEEIAVLNGEIEKFFLSEKRGFGGPGENIPERDKILSLQSTRLIGTGGTITTLASMDMGLREYDYRKVQKHRIPIGRLYRLRDMLLSLPSGERQHVDGLEAGRADLIIPGILLTIRMMEIFGFDEITVSDYGLLEGLIKETDDEKGF